ncbi:MAG: hypothetical protein L0H24_12895 [Microlunatus sp.]|nr:hypothetical protein [Microlunatus sp.]
MTLSDGRSLFASGPFAESGSGGSGRSSGGVSAAEEAEVADPAVSFGLYGPGGTE